MPLLEDKGGSMKKIRNFIGHAVGVYICFWGSFVEAKTATLTILTFNDVYEIVPDEKGRGGFAELMTLLEKERKTSPYCITTMNGDFLSPCILSVFDKGAHRIELFNAMGIDVVCVGNHEFDFGPDEMLKRVNESNFPWFASNALGLDGRPFTGDQQTIILDVDGIKVGFFGLITIETPELSSTEKKVCFAPLVYTAKKTIEELRSQGAEVIVALTHLLFADDRQLAKEVPDIHVMLGGHDHDPITWYDDQTFIHKSGQNAYYLARIDLVLEKDEISGKVDVFPSWKVILNKGQEREEHIAVIVDRLQTRLEEITGETIGEVQVPFDTLYSNVRTKEVVFGNLVADALCLHYGADAAILSGGIIRGNRWYEPKQKISLKDILIEMPFGNVNVVVEMQGKDILEALENGVSQVEGKAGRFPQVSGLCFSYDASLPAGQRVFDVSIQESPLDVEKIYKIATVDYMFHGGDGYNMFKGKKLLISPLRAESLVDVVAEYIKKSGNVGSDLDGRITVRDALKRLDEVHFSP